MHTYYTIISVDTFEFHKIKFRFFPNFKNNNEKHFTNFHDASHNDNYCFDFRYVFIFIHYKK